MSEPLIGEIRMFGGQFAPRGWGLCDGQLLPVTEHEALFSILGTTYGGDGTTMFGLPDLRGRVPVHAGTGPGLSERRLGEKAGEQSTTLTVDNLPSHTHAATVTVLCKNAVGNKKTAARNVWSHSTSSAQYSDKAPDATMHAGSVQVAIGGTGHSHPFATMPPYQVFNFIIALEGQVPTPA